MVLRPKSPKIAVKHFRNRPFFPLAFFTFFASCIAALVLGFKLIIQPETAAWICGVCFVLAGLSAFCAVTIARCCGCGKVLFNLKPDKIGSSHPGFREFVCPTCGDSTFVKGEYRFGDSD